MTNTREFHKAIGWFLNRNSPSWKGMAWYICFKWWKGRICNQECSTQKASHSDLMEKPKTLHRSKSYSVQHHQNSFTTLANFSRQQTQENEMTYKKEPKTIKKMVIGSWISIIILNVNGLNAPIKNHRLTGWMKTCVCMHFHLTHFHYSTSPPPPRCM